MSSQFTPNNPLPQEAPVPREMAKFSAEVEAEIEAHLAKYPEGRSRSALIPLMFVVQRERGWLDPEGVAYLADRLRLRITDVWEVATFYSMINTKPVGKYHLQVCRTLSCKIMGADAITKHCSERLGIEPGGTTEDGRFSLSEVECLGSCGTAPMLQLGVDYHENLTPEKVDDLLERCRRDEYEFKVEVR
ncbi:MAG TPA: NADH-quinone oxidoreductase subunit NuoE [Pyrinomonadaceae bacterium]|jgi:NADH-quinone oxidoreductase subunit E